jgi:hypothetical protein
VGGDGNSSAATAELYHPSTGSFSPLGATHRGDPTQLLLLNNGNALAIGASGTDVYNPATGRFTSSGNLLTPRTKFGAAVLPDGRVLVAGGQTGACAWGSRITTTEIYDPRTDRFTPGPDLTVKRFKLSRAIVPLRNGRILVAGGADYPEMYDPALRAFLPVRGQSRRFLLFDGHCSQRRQGPACRGLCQSRGSGSRSRLDLPAITGGARRSVFAFISCRSHLYQLTTSTM